MRHEEKEEGINRIRTDMLFREKPTTSPTYTINNNYLYGYEHTAQVVHMGLLVVDRPCPLGSGLGQTTGEV